MLPVLRVCKQNVKAIADGCPWVMRHQAIESSEWLSVMPGSLARVETERGGALGVGMVNPLSQIVCRMLSWQQEAIDQEFFEQKISAALAKRGVLFDTPFYRLIHAEADGLPGLVVDRFGEHIVVQVASAGMENLQAQWLAALDACINPATIFLRNDSGARKLEGLVQQTLSLKGAVPELLPVMENGCTYFADVVHGQKTGWYYDMRDNRVMVAELARGKNVLDVFSHSGGFGVLAVQSGAASVVMVDASELALALAMRAAETNGVAERCRTIKGDAVAVMKQLADEGARYDIIIADPPAYVKSKKDIVSGMKGYEKVACHAAALVASGGYLFTASCSHHASRGAFNKAVLAGIARTGRTAEIIRQTGASRDHPIHPRLPQSEYLKGLLLRVF